MSAHTICPECRAELFLFEAELSHEGRLLCCAECDAIWFFRPTTELLEQIAANRLEQQQWSEQSASASAATQARAAQRLKKSILIGFGAFAVFALSAIGGFFFLNQSAEKPKLEVRSPTLRWTEVDGVVEVLFSLHNPADQAVELDGLCIVFADGDGHRLYRWCQAGAQAALNPGAVIDQLFYIVGPPAQTKSVGIELGRPAPETAEPPPAGH